MSIAKRINDKYQNRYVEKVLTEDAEYIAQEQTKLVSAYNLFETGALKSSLQGNFTVQGDNAKTLRMRYVKYMRFLDMKSVRSKRKQYHIYNKILFGVLYNRTYRKLIFGFTETVKQEIISEMGTQTIEL
jgi:hypothetical protein